jgi:Glycosyl Hydrolase Family 88
VVLIGGHGPRARTSSALAPPQLGPMQLVPALSLSADAGRRVRALPSTAWVLSFDVSLAARSRVAIGFGSSTDQIVLSRAAGATARLDADGRSYALTNRRGWGRGPWRHVEVVSGASARLAIDGHQFPISIGNDGRLSFQLGRGRAELRALVISSATDRASLLFHRLAELHARLSPGAFPLAADRFDRLHLHSAWTSGFWPGALWQAAALEPAGGMFAQWALRATIAHFGLERLPTHDVGFMYGESSLAAWRALCRNRRSADVICAHLKRSALQAANELLALAASNPGAGTIPTRVGSREGETIVDSMMNIGILPWATSVTHDPAYVRLASHQAHVIAALLVRRNGSTSQAVHFDRPTGRIRFIGTHQGLADNSTWARGQGWAIYGFAQAAADLHDRALLDVAQHLAGYVAQRLPSGGVPFWDYDAPAGSPHDVSAGAVTAAGLLHLAAACTRFRDGCPDPARWISLARRMLAGALQRAQPSPPIGFLGSQILNGRRRTCCNGSELIFGLTYALEALRLERTFR